MDNSNSAAHTFDWRTGMPPDARERIVSKLTDALKKHLPHSGEEGLNELKKIAEKFEENIYSTATSQLDYLSKISSKMLSTETGDRNSIQNDRACGVGSLGMNNQVQPPTMPLQPTQPQSFQPLMPQTMQNQARVQISPLSSSSARFSPIQNSMPNLIPQNPKVGSNLQNPIGNVMTGQGSVANNKYLQIQKLLQQQQLQRQKSQQLQLVGAQQRPQAPPPSVRSAYQNPISLLPGASASVRAADQNPISLLPGTSASVPAADQNPITLLPGTSASVRAADQNPISLLPGTSAVPLATFPISAGQIGSVNGAEWQDEIYRKIKLMKDLYLPELLELQVKITTSLQRYDSLPKNEESEALERLKLLKFMLEKAISFLEVSKPNISEKYKNNQELVLRERQIMNFVNMTRPGNLFSQMPQPPTSGRTVWATEHQAKPQVQIPAVPQSPASSLISRVQEAATKIRSEKKSSPLSEPLVSDSNSVTGFGVSPCWVVLGLALMMFLALVLNIVVLLSA